MTEINQEQEMQAAKEQCLFCKIIKGEVPSRKVYEDEVLVAILDINPAAKGHVLVLPKEHYPILPLIPVDVTQKLFEKTKKIMDAQRKALLCEEITLFIANGVVAGQQSPHFIYHLIPRDSGDGLDLFSPHGIIPPQDNQALLDKIKLSLGSLMKAYLTHTKRFEYEIAATPQKQADPVATHTTKNQEDTLAELIESNRDLRDALIERPDEVKKAVKEQEKWKKLFAGINIDQLSRNLRLLSQAKTEKEAQGDESP